ncbi:MAG: acyl-homoserine-lactone synthase [Alphaproteobacteria bacterium]
MIHIVTPETALTHHDLLEQAYRMRHRIFVEEKGWAAWTKPDRRERDEYDPGGSISFLAMSQGRVAGCARLVPGGGMNKEIITKEKLAALTSRPQFCGLGRFCVETEIRGGTKIKNLASGLILSVLDYALENDIPKIFCETDPNFLILLRFLGLRVEFVGKPMPYYGRTMLMGIIDVTEEGLENCRDRLDLNDFHLGERMAV